MRHAKQAHTRIPVPARPGACQLTVRDLGVTLEGTEILQDVSFQLNCREIVALIGPNGAGRGLPQPPQDRLRPPKPQL